MAFMVVYGTGHGPSLYRRPPTVVTAPSHSLARNEWSPRRIQGFLEEIAELFAGLQQFAHERIRLVIRIERVDGDESMVG